MNNNNNEFESMGNSVMGKIYPYLIDDLKAYYNNPLSNKKILEIGTGPGFIIKELLKEDFSTVYGIDISLDMLIRAYKNNFNNQNLKLINAKAESIPLKSNSIDIVFSRGSIFFWKDIEKAFNEINRIAKPNAFILIGGGYGISTPDSIIKDIKYYYEKKIEKKEKPKLEIDYLLKLIDKLGYEPHLVSKPQHGFWIYWKK